MLLDFNNIMENELFNSGVNFLIDATQFYLNEDNRYTFKVCKIPKFDEFNMNKFIWVIKNTLGKVHDAGGIGYEELFEKLNSA